MTEKQKENINLVFGPMEFVKSEGGGYYIAKTALYTFHIIEVGDSWRLILNLSVNKDFDSFEQAKEEAEKIFFKRTLDCFPNILKI